MKRILSISLVSASILFAVSPIHDVMDSKLKGKSFGGTLDDHEAAQDGLGIISLNGYSAPRDIANELIEHKVLNKLLKSETDKTKTADVRTSLTSGLLGTEEDKSVLTSVGVELTAPSLYAFTSHTFTNCGVTGRYGPTLSQCRSSYNVEWELDTSLYNMTTQGIQVWTVPADGTYRIMVAGAAGGGTNSGKGAIISGEFNFSVGDKLSIAIGQKGDANPNGSSNGGGGSFVVSSSNEPLIIAGGGAGAINSTLGLSDNGSYLNSNSQNSVTIGEGGYSEPYYKSLKGHGYGAGGAGFYSNGEDGYAISSSGGKSWFNGLIGGAANNSIGGGFGGGGGHTNSGPNITGGGGGYTGGTGGYDGISSNNGEGGGSYNVGSNPTTEGYNLNHGYVIITKI